MTTLLPLSLACGDYDINRALLDGSVTPQGIQVTALAYSSPERHWRMLRHLEFDICEFSVASYLMAHGRGDFGAVAIPAFPHRRFRHGFIYVNAAAGIREPKDLEGRRVGVRTWQTTAGLWGRGILQDEHGVDLTSIDWFSQDEEDIPLPAGRADAYRLERVPAGQTMTGMLERGELDALIYPEEPDNVRRGDPRVARLFPDTKAAEIAFFEKTRFFPIMHVVLIRRTILEEHPWVAGNVLTAFRESKRRAFDAMRDPRRISLAWFADALREQERLLGADPWTYSFEPNRTTLETMIRWSHEQGMIERPFAPEDLFVSATLDEVPAYV